MNKLKNQEIQECKYYDIEDFTKLNLNNREHLNIFSLNISSLPKHRGELVCFINSLETEFDIIILSEIGKRNLSTVENLFHGYSSFFNPPVNNNKGGVCVFINNKLGRTARNFEFEFTKTCECATCEVESLCLTFQMFDLNFCVYAVYRHPKGNKKHFIKDLKLSLEKIDNKYITYLIGDININLISFESSQDHGDYASMLFSQSYMPLITFPTRITPHSATLIDHIFIKSPNNKASLLPMAGILYCNISDHLACFTSMKTKKVMNNTNRPKVRLFGQNQCNNFVEKMNNFDWNNLFSDGVDWYHEFISCVINFYHSSFPLVTLSKKRSKDKVWITKGLKISCKTKSKLYRNSIIHPNSPAAARYSTYNRILKICLKKAESTYHSEIFRKYESSTRQLWNHINSMINSGKIRQIKPINKINYRGKFHTSDEEIASAMNEHFCTIGDRLQSSLPSCQKDAFKKYMPPSNLHTFVLSHTTKHDILREINKLDSKKAFGPDGIGAKIIKLCPEVFANNLQKAFNQSIDKAEYPCELKIARVIALFKKGDPSLPDNYRPISLLSCFNKIFERLICVQLMSFLEKYKILVKFQFGFRKGHSTILALTEITDNIRQHIDNRNYVLGLFVDLSKAFDTVDHEILLSKLSHYGIRGHANKFFRSYLSGRKQYTYINNVSSPNSNINCGVPQGSVLGPILFLIYINDLCNALDENICRLFADDTGIFTHGQKLNDLIDESIPKYKRLFQWCIENRLTINYSKTCFIIFHNTKQKVPNDLQTILINDIVISRVHTTKYLGLILDETLSWKDHIIQLCRGLSKFFGIFKRIRDAITFKIQKQLYYAFIYSRINYGLQIYGSCSDCLLNRIQTMSNKLLKYLAKFDMQMPTVALHKYFEFLKVKDIYEVNVLHFVRNCLHNDSPNIFKDYFTFQTHNYRVRNRKLYLPPHRTKFGSLSLKIVGVGLWEKLPNDIKNKSRLKSFRKILKKFYLSKY